MAARPPTAKAGGATSRIPSRRRADKSTPALIRVCCMSAALSTYPTRLLPGLLRYEAASLPARGTEPAPGPARQRAGPALSSTVVRKRACAERLLRNAPGARTRRAAAVGRANATSWGGSTAPVLHPSLEANFPILVRAPSWPPPRTGAEPPPDRRPPWPRLREPHRLPSGLSPVVEDLNLGPASRPTP